MRISDWSSDVCSSDLFGGEEFVVGLPNHDLHDAVEVAESLRRALVESPCGTQGHSIRISASVGVHTVTPGSVDSIDAALEIADRALYAAKANGRDCVKRSEEHTSELQSLMRISYAVFCMKIKNYPVKTKHNLHLREY